MADPGFRPLSDILEERAITDPRTVPDVIVWLRAAERDCRDTAAAAKSRPGRSGLESFLYLSARAEAFGLAAALLERVI